MDTKSQKKAAKEFAEEWKNQGSEKRDCHRFWLGLLRDVFGVEKPEKYIDFEKPVQLEHQSYIDGYIPDTKVLIEQKSIDKDLDKPEPQSDGPDLEPIRQARRYEGMMATSEQPRWIIVCNFREFWIYDEEHRNNPPYKIKLEDLPKEYHHLQFLVEEHNEQLQEELDLSVRAGELVGKLYDAFLKQYQQPVSKEDLHSLNVLCVRLVFCLYAENGGIFGTHTMFHDYMVEYPTQQMRYALEELFKVLDQPENQRDKHLKTDFPKRAAFPYVNGGLFDQKEKIEIPMFTEEIRTILLDQCSAGFDWSGISPTIFGAVFESTLNPETRRSGGMHYTSVENIHKVIDPLFLDDLKAEFNEIQQIAVEKTRRKKLQDFQKKLAGLTFLDPACGSGNFLTETYLSLRRLENDILRELSDQITMGDVGFSPIQVSLDQFYGIEINDFAVSVAMTALWIAESQMMQETEDIVQSTLDFLPLTTNTGIHRGNALRMDWNSVIQSFKLNYIMGNPPFIGASVMTKEQKEDAVAIFGKGKLVNSIDYVGAWYYKAAEFMQDTKIQAALVSTNSITQGEQVAPLWKKLYEQYHIHIDFAYRTFRWDSEASLKAHVHCVIVGFSVCKNQKQKLLFDGGNFTIVDQINPYLVNGPIVFIESRPKPLFDVPKITKGNQPTDGGNLILSEQEKDEILKKDPSVSPCIRRYLGAKDFINQNEVRYCLWLKDIQPSVYRKNAEIMRRIEAVREMRLKSSAAPTRAAANKPHLFFSMPQTDTNYIVIPRHSSETRKYIPMGIETPDIIASDSVQIIMSSSLYLFGVLMSNVHMAWVRAICGRLEMRYRYSAAIVYNNFPWSNPTSEQKAKIEQTAQEILDVRAKYPDCSLADLYDPKTMPQDLQMAHHKNDYAVMQAYGWGKNSEPYHDESACVAELMKLYQQKVGQ